MQTIAEEKDKISVADVPSTPEQISEQISKFVTGSQPLPATKNQSLIFPPTSPVTVLNPIGTPPPNYYQDALESLKQQQLNKSPAVTAYFPIYTPASLRCCEKCSNLNNYWLVKITIKNKQPEKVTLFVPYFSTVISFPNCPDDIKFYCNLITTQTMRVFSPVDYEIQTVSYEIPLRADVVPHDYYLYYLWQMVQSGAEPPLQFSEPTKEWQNHKDAVLAAEQKEDKQQEVRQWHHLPEVPDTLPAPPSPQHTNWRKRFIAFCAQHKWKIIIALALVAGIVTGGIGFGIAGGAIGAPHLIIVGVGFLTTHLGLGGFVAAVSGGATTIGTFLFRGMVSVGNLARGLFRKIRACCSGNRNSASPSANPQSSDSPTQLPVEGHNTTGILQKLNKHAPVTSTQDSKQQNPSNSSEPPQSPKPLPSSTPTSPSTHPIPALLPEASSLPPHGSKTQITSPQSSSNSAGTSSPRTI